MYNGWNSGPTYGPQRVSSRPSSVVSPHSHAIGQMRAAMSFRSAMLMPISASTWQHPMNYNTPNNLRPPSQMRSPSDILGGAPFFRTRADAPRGPTPLLPMGLPYSCPPPHCCLLRPNYDFCFRPVRLHGPPPEMAVFLGNPYGPTMSRPSSMVTGAPFMARPPLFTNPLRSIESFLSETFK